MAESPSLAPFSISLAGREDAVRSGLADAMAQLSSLQLVPDDASTVELVLAEALNNIVEHALANARAPSQIDIHGTHGPQGLELLIVDQGVPMPEGVAPSGLQPDVDVAIADMPEGGFGWFMIHALATRVHYARVEQANHLTLLLPVGL